MHRCWVTKPPIGHASEGHEDDKGPNASPEQMAVIGQMTDILREIILRCVSQSSDPNRPLKDSPFQLFEIDPRIASLLGLNEQCWVMLEQSDQTPTVIFEDRDLARLGQRSVAELTEAASALQHQVGNPAAAILVTVQ